MNIRTAIFNQLARVGYPAAAFTFAAALSLAPATQAQAFRVLVFHGTGGFVHDAIPSANKLFVDLAAANNFAVDVSAAANVFSAANLARYKVVVWNNTTKPGGILNPDQKAAYLNWAKTGGYLGIHSATDTEGTWPDMIEMVGAELSSHGTGDPYVRKDPEGAGHEVTAGLVDSSRMDEEWYSFKTNPRGLPGLKVMYIVDENTCRFCVKMGDHPAAWTRELPTGGRLFYMAMGHMPYVFNTHKFTRDMLLNAVKWTAKAGTPSVLAAPDVPGAVDIQAGSASLTVSFPDEGDHRAEVFTLDGRKAAFRSGSGAKSYAIGGLRAGAVYAVVTKSSAGRVVKRVALP